MWIWFFLLLLLLFNFFQYNFCKIITKFLKYNITKTLSQLRVEAKDGGNPALSATALVTINVERNLFSPVFAQDTYAATIFETQDLGSAILTVFATDADIRVSSTYFVHFIILQISQRNEKSIFKNSMLSFQRSVDIHLFVF